MKKTSPFLRPQRVLAAWLALVCLVGPADVRGCPFCTAVSQTFTEEIDAMDVVVFARIVEGVRELPEPGTTTELPKSKFAITSLIKGDKWVQLNDTVEAHYFGRPDAEAIYLIMGTDPPAIMWSSPLVISERAGDYIIQASKLPTKGAQRLRFFMRYFEDDDEMLARDAYDEFANAPYADVEALKADMDHDQLVAWINDDKVPVNRRRLYLTMLGACGNDQDATMLEELMRSPDRLKKAGLDAMIGCYLSLRGAEGMPLIEDLFLGNEEAEYSDTYSAIMAVRILGTETKVIPRGRLLEGLRMVLERADLADLVIPDLARWEDWSVMPRLVQLFKDADEDSKWVRVPVINYLRACPLEESKRQIEKLKEIDPDAVKRANTFFPFSQAAAPGRGSSRNAGDSQEADAAPGKQSDTNKDS